MSSTPTESELLINCKNAKFIKHEVNIAGRNYRGPGGGTLMSKPNLTPTEDVDFDKIKFHTDDGSYMACYYKKSTFIKCKVSPPKYTSSANKS